LGVVDVVGFFANEPGRTYKIDSASLEDSVGVSPTRVLVGTVELVFGVHAVVAEDVAVAFDNDHVCFCRCCPVDSDAVAGSVGVVDVSPLEVGPGIGVVVVGRAMSRNLAGSTPGG
jgi:hypothetical protein